MTLTDPQRSALSILQRTYGMQYAQWQAKDTALQYVNEVIKSTTGQHYQSYITGIATPYERLKELRSRVAPVDANRLIEARKAYRTALQGVKRTAWETWIHTWEKAFKDGEKLKIAKVNGDLPVYDFLDAIAPVSAHFAEYWHFTCNNKKNSGAAIPTAQDIAKEWRDYMRSKANMRGNAFDASLQGQPPAESSTGNWPPPCVCGTKHPYRECPYLIPELRPAGWKADPEVEKRVRKALKNDKVCGGVERAKQRYTASHTSPASPSPASSAAPAPKPAAPAPTTDSKAKP